MAITYVYRESENQKTQLVALTQKDKDGNQVLSGSDFPVITVDTNHHRLHEGRAFLAEHLINNGSTLADQATIDFVFACPLGIYPHVTLSGSCGGDAELFFFEGTVSTGGTLYTPIRRNRSIVASSNVAMVLNPTISSAGTTLISDLIVGGGKTKTGGGEGSGLEFVMNPLTNYMARLKNVSGAPQVAHLSVEWYE